MSSGSVSFTTEKCDRSSLSSSISSNGVIPTFYRTTEPGVPYATNVRSQDWVCHPRCVPASSRIRLAARGFEERRHKRSGLLRRTRCPSAYSTSKARANDDSGVVWGATRWIRPMPCHRPYSDTFTGGKEMFASYVPFNPQDGTFRLSNTFPAPEPLSAFLVGTGLLVLVLRKAT